MIVGSWKIVHEGNTMQYVAFTEEKLINKSESVTGDYILSETQSDTFIIEVIHPENGQNIFMLEGALENKDTIIILDTPDGPMEDTQFIRIDNITEDQAKEEDADYEKASGEVDAKDRLTFTTRERTYYLIENYLKE